MVVTPRSPWAWGPPALALLLFAGLLASGRNQALFLYLNHAGGRLGASTWAHLTLLGDGAVALALVLPLIRRAPHCFWAALIAAVFAALWVQGVKQLVNVPRPLAVLSEAQFFQTGPPYRAVSFPSGHAAAIFALCGVLVMGVVRHRLARTVLLVLAVLVGLSRVMVGVHWPLDVLWGMFGGWLGAGFGLAVAGKRGWRTANALGLAAGVVLLVLAGTLLFSNHIGIPVVLPLQRFIGGACLLAGAAELFLLLVPAGWRGTFRGSTQRK